jgi:poly(3-hydroxybutyrate) depolymerase
MKLLRLLTSALLAGSAAAAPPLAVDADLARTFEHGQVHFRQDGSVLSRRINDAMPLLRLLDRSAFRGTVVYLHGCDGINSLGIKTADLLAAAGYLVFVPDSFARQDKPPSCDPRQFQGGLHREVLGWRQAEAEHALTQARTLPAVDPSRIFLMGLSEGAIAAATYVGEPLTGRIIEGWTCHAGWPEYRGLRAPPDEAVLALSSENDPWFQDPVLRGDCGDFIAAPSLLRRSIVFRPPHPAASQHDLMWNAEARRLVLEFLDAAGLRR